MYKDMNYALGVQKERDHYSLFVGSYRGEQ